MDINCNEEIKEAEKNIEEQGTENPQDNDISDKKLSYARLAVLSTALVISVCGISYELLAATVSSYFLGNAVLQYSLTIGVFLFAMGIGSYISGRMEEGLLEKFLTIEIIIGLVGGFATLILFAAYRFTEDFSIVMYSLLLILGTLIGLEIPILIRILKDYRALHFSIADVLSFDYIGALVASILFPLFVLPYMGMMHASFFYAILNMIIVFLNISVFGEILKKRKFYTAISAAVTLILVLGFAFSNNFVTFFEHKMYDDEVIFLKQTKYQRIVLTKFKEDLRLFLDGNLQFSSWDEYRYHECLVHPAMSLSINRENVIILGGGDGLAAREVLKYPDVKHITLVDIDPDMTSLCKNDPFISELNNNSLKDPKLSVVNEDAFKYIENSKERYGVIIVDLPDPNNEGLSKLYSREFYTLIKNHLARGGMIVIQSTSPYFAHTAFWCIVHTVGSAGLNIEAYHAYVPSFGDWGFTLASNVNIDTSKINIAVDTQYLNPGRADDLFIFGKDASEIQTQINTLDTHYLLRYYDNEWKKWD